MNFFETIFETMSGWQKWMEEAQQQEDDWLEAQALARQRLEDEEDRRWLRSLREKRAREKFEREQAKKQNQQPPKQQQQQQQHPEPKK